MTPLEKVKWMASLACDKNLSDSAVRVGVYLAHCLNGKTGQLNPANSTIHEATGLSKRGIQYAIAALIDGGWAAHIKTGNGRGKPTEYKLLKGANFDTSKGANSAPVKKVKGANFDTERVQISTIKGANFDNPPIPPYKEEPVKEPVKGTCEGSTGGDKSPPAKPEKVKSISRVAKKKPVTRETWTAYADAYQSRYGVPPVRNASVNSQLAAFVKRIGVEESPHVAAFFLQSRNSYYSTRGHSVGALLSDAEKLRTEWATGNQVTATKARQADKSQTNFDAVTGALKILEGRS